MVSARVTMTMRTTGTMTVKKHSTGALTDAQRAARDERYRQRRDVVYDYLFVGTGNAAEPERHRNASSGDRL